MWNLPESNDNLEIISFIHALEEKNKYVYQFFVGVIKSWFNAFEGNQVCTQYL